MGEGCQITVRSLGCSWLWKSRKEEVGDFGTTQRGPRSSGSGCCEELRIRFRAECPAEVPIAHHCLLLSLPEF